MLKIPEYALRSLARRWRKYLSLILVYALVVAFYASVVLFTASLQQETQASLQSLPELWVQKLAGGRLQPMPVAFLDSLKGIRGVKRIIPRVWGYNFDTPTGAVLTVMGSDSLLSGLSMVRSIHKGKLQGNMALVGQGLMKLRNLEVGESLTLLNDQGQIIDYDIVGTFADESDLLTTDLVILAPPAAKKLLGLDANTCTDVALEIHNPLEINNIGRKIDRRFAGIRVVTAPQLKATYQTLFGWRGGIFVYGTILSVFAFLILAWEKAGGLSREEKNELGVLKATGWEISDVLWLKFWESGFVSLNATAIGILIAYIHVFVAQAPLLRPFLIGWSVLYPEYQLSPVFDLESFGLIFSLSVIPYLTATLVPAWRGAITDPAEVMQG